MEITAHWTSCHVVLEGVFGPAVGLTFNNLIRYSRHLQSLALSCPLKVLTWMKFSFQIDTQLKKQLWYIFFSFFTFKTNDCHCPLQCPLLKKKVSLFWRIEVTVLHSVMKWCLWQSGRLAGAKRQYMGIFKGMSVMWKALEDHKP